MMDTLKGKTFRRNNALMMEELERAGWKLLAGCWYHPDPFHHKVYVSLAEAYNRHRRDVQNMTELFTNERRRAIYK